MPGSDETILKVAFVSLPLLSTKTIDLLFLDILEGLMALSLEDFYHLILYKK